MTKNIFLIVFLGLLFNSQPINCMERKRAEAEYFPSFNDMYGAGSEKRLRKRRKKVSIYAQYKSEDGRYECPEPGCKHWSANYSTFTSHCFSKRHGSYKNKVVKKRKSIFDQYKSEDGTYECPESGCTHSTKHYDHFRAHLSWHRKQVSKRHQRQYD